MGKKKLVLDTNVLISALGFDGKERKILARCVRGDFLFCLNQAMLREIERVLEYPKFKFTQDQKDSFKLILTEKAQIVFTPGTLNIVKDDPSDDAILETALTVSADFIITGDNHLLKIRGLSGVVIINASRFLGLINL